MITFKWKIKSKDIYIKMNNKIYKNYNYIKNKKENKKINVTNRISKIF